MITKYKNSFITSVILALALITTSCNLSDQEDLTGLSTLNATSPDITITGDFDLIEGVEKDLTIPFTLTLSEPQISDIHVPVFTSGGTATEGKDYVINTPMVIIPAYATSATGSISTFADTDPEEDETFSITIGDYTVANTVFTPQTFDFTMSNFESENLNMIFDWDGGIEYAGTVYPICGNIDLDIFAFDGDGNFVGWVAATGDCPEILTLTPADYPDGKYIFYHDLWSNGFAGLGTDTLVPITTTVVQPGVFSDSAVQADDQAMNSDMFGGADTPSVGHNGFVVTIIVSNGTYTIDTSTPASKATIDKLKSMPKPNK